MDSSQKFTVITVVKNSVNTIQRAIDSVINQTYSSVEYIVVDGESTDGTLDIIKKNSKNISKLIIESDSGLYDAMNKGLKLAEGKFIHFLNADDYYYSNETIENIFPLLDDRHICYADMIYINKKNEKILQSPDFSFHAELIASHIPQPATFVSSKLYAKHGGFNLGYRVSADYEMFLRLASLYPVKHINLITTVMTHGGISSRMVISSFRESRKISISYGRGIFKANFDYIFKLINFFIITKSPCFIKNGFKLFSKFYTRLS